MKTEVWRALARRGERQRITDRGEIEKRGRARAREGQRDKGDRGAQIIKTMPRLSQRPDQAPTSWRSLRQI
eukprot:1317233-Rhodomonas_salina.4